MRHNAQSFDRKSRNLVLYISDFLIQIPSDSMLVEDMASQILDKGKWGSANMTMLVLESCVLDHMLSQMGVFLESLGTFRTYKGFPPVNEECLHTNHHIKFRVLTWCGVSKRFFEWSRNGTVCKRTAVHQCVWACVLWARRTLWSAYDNAGKREDFHAWWPKSMLYFNIFFDTFDFWCGDQDCF